MQINLIVTLSNYEIMRQLLIIITFLSLSNILAGQIYINPKYAKKGNVHIELKKITITDNYTIVEIEHTNPFEYGGWANIYASSFIRTDNGKKHKLLKVKGIPVSPSRHEYIKKGDKLRFKLYFSPINPASKHLDIIEYESDSRAFNIYKVKLKPIA